MTREHKLALIIGFTLVLVVGVLISDHFSKARLSRVNSDLAASPARNLAVDGLRPVGFTPPTSPNMNGFGPAMAMGQTGSGQMGSGQMGSSIPPTVLPPVNDPMAAREGTDPNSGITMGTMPLATSVLPENGRIAVELNNENERTRTLMNEATRRISPGEGFVELGNGSGQNPNLNSNLNPMGQLRSGGGSSGEVRPILPTGPRMNEMVQSRDQVPPPQLTTVRPNQTPQFPKEELINGVPLKLCTRHDVREGESIFRIAKEKYGDGMLWNKLLDYNKGKVAANGSMREGVTLLLPPREALLGKPLPSINPPAPTNTPKPTIVPLPPLPGKTTKPSESAMALVPKAAARTYTVQKGDVLSDVSRKMLGTSKRWMEIHELNKDVLDSEDALVVGMTLKLPAR